MLSGCVVLVLSLVFFPKFVVFFTKTSFFVVCQREVFCWEALKFRQLLGLKFDMEGPMTGCPQSHKQKRSGKFLALILGNAENNVPKTI